MTIRTDRRDGLYGTQLVHLGRGGACERDDSPSPGVSDREDADVIDVVEVLDEELDQENDAGEEPTDG